MLSQILHFLLETIFGFFVFVLLARFYLQLMRAPFRNPLGQFVSRAGPIGWCCRRDVLFPEYSAWIWRACCWPGW